MATVPGMHLTPIGDGAVLLEPTEGLDPSEPERYLEGVLHFLRRQGAARVIYDLQTTPVIDTLYYRWMVQLHRACQACGMELVAVNIRPSAAFALALHLDATPPFRCARGVDRVCHEPAPTV